jgi:D-glycero-alpha-D-manno-heptose-7-phosphate kinase
MGQHENHDSDAEPARVIEASAPVRICDNGGWTDTWFGGPGRVLNVAVTPGVDVTMASTDGPESIVLDVGGFGDRYPVVPGASRVARHPLLEAAIDALPPPAAAGPLEITIRSVVPAAVAVALLGALTLARSEAVVPRDIAYGAHRLETDVLGVESGIQDQLSSAFGGISYLEIDPYPEAALETLPAWEELGPLLTLVFLGRPHDSSSVHLQVIDDLSAAKTAALADLRGAAAASRTAVIDQDLVGFGRAMIANTDAQRALHPALVGQDARAVIEIATAHGALGWKVNGAGGDGGSVTILNASHAAKAPLEREVASLDPRYRVLPIAISPTGLQVHGAL